MLAGCLPCRKSEFQREIKHGLGWEEQNNQEHHLQVVHEVNSKALPIHSEQVWAGPAPVSTDQGKSSEEPGCGGGGLQDTTTTRPPR